MKIATYSIENPVITWMIILACLFGGIWGTLTVGKLEDPDFAVRQAIIQTSYSGATATEVEQEVTERLESAIQQLSQLQKITSRSMPGRSEITVEIRDDYPSERIPQTWDELRRKVNDVMGDLPPGVGTPSVNDDFGDVFGVFYAVTAEGFSDQELHELATFMRREVLTVPGVARAEVAGIQEERFYIDIPNERLISLGMSVDQIANTFRTENAVANAGSIMVDDRRIRLVSRPGLDSIRAIEETRVGRPGTTEQVRIADIATVSRKPVETPSQLIRQNGVRAFTLAVAGQSDLNIVDIGYDVDRHLAQLQDRMPLGVELEPIYQQHVVVDEAISNFMISLLLSVSIVVAVLCVAMGWRVGVVVGGTLFLTVLGSVFFMRVFGIEMERISLGALIIAMGMLVDNAIVMAEAMLLNMQRGQSALRAADDAARRTQIPLLGATVIGIMAFAGIGLSPDVTGDFLFSLFAVICISLLLSWLLAVTVTPLLGYYLFRVRPGLDADNLYSGAVYRAYGRVLGGAMRHRVLTVLVLVGLTAISVVGFGQVKQAFFPASNTPILFVNYFLPQGSDITATDRDIRELEQFVMAQPEVESVTGFVGRGASRFMLTYSPEQPDSAYGHLIVRTSDRHQIPAVMERIRSEMTPKWPDSELYLQQMMFGPGDGGKIEARFIGPNEQELRQLAEEASAIMATAEGVVDVRQNWRDREIVMLPVFNENRARMAGITRTDVAEALEFATVGQRTGSFREGDRQIPIVVRPPAVERLDMDRLNERSIWSDAEQNWIPITQVIDGFRLSHEEAMIHRRDRMRTITVQADPEGDLTAVEALNRIKAQVEAIDLPIGYRMEWGGEYENSRRAQSSLGSQLPLSFLIMLVISVLLFGKVRQPVVIWSVVPMAICGVTAGLLLTNMPFTFTALLGLLSLSGMLMKNAIVLVDEIDERIRLETNPASAIINASISRFRPVILAALTTILGMIPLLRDAFFDSMAVTIMSGLAFATILTLVAAPVIYALIFRIRPEAGERA